MTILFRLLINAAALILISNIVPGIVVEGTYIAIITALILGLLNIIIRPIVHFFSLPITIVTLGFFALVINALFFWFVATFVDGFTVLGFWPAFWGALIMSIVSWLSSKFLK